MTVLIRILEKATEKDEAAEKSQQLSYFGQVCSTKPERTPAIITLAYAGIHTWQHDNKKNSEILVGLLQLKRHHTITIIIIYQRQKEVKEIGVQATEALGGGHESRKLH